ncbi:hypothetical protein B484DRAFT_454391 [Ochromonadaceae sp. CCMP2298]|nr:hypothetical protein B484DRAFT_454391 [Ochromonadaceae sp. CCMP2298]|mmetsp:Transcript_21614/g.48122  ORF Transcript_21614/g.48122 Transcript_21614/m.48122 type:complete len:185 (-) Transcript_21614:149-703(-)
MPCFCDSCEQTSNRFSRKEFSLGKRGRASTCTDCEKEVARCAECYREFTAHSWSNALNQLKMHKQTHAERTIACPVCNGSKRFRTGADAALHLESGYCEGCLGKDNAERAIFNFVSQQARSLMSPLMIENGSGSVPEQAYCCNDCGKRFNLVSALMQHSKAKHGQSQQLMVDYDSDPDPYYSDY